MPANQHTWTAIASGANGDAYTLPYQTLMHVTLQIIPTGSASVAMQVSLDGGTTWTALTGLTAVTSATVATVTGAIYKIRPAVTVSGSATIHMTWSTS